MDFMLNVADMASKTLYALQSEEVLEGGTP
jgi:hypothetical protein